MQDNKKLIRKTLKSICKINKLELTDEGVLTNKIPENALFFKYYYQKILTPIYHFLKVLGIYLLILKQGGSLRSCAMKDIVPKNYTIIKLDSKATEMIILIKRSTTDEIFNFPGNFSSDSQFFVFIGNFDRNIFFSLSVGLSVCFS